MARPTSDPFPIARVDAVTSGLKRFYTAFLGLMALATQLSPAAAKPLLSEICVKLASEHIELGKGGVEESMNHDPEKAGEILKPEELAKIERYLFIEGQIRFRCPEIRLPGIKVPDLSKTKEAGIDDAKPKTRKKRKGPPAPPPKRNPDTEYEGRS